MGKISMLPFVVQYVCRLVARNAFLDVEDLAAFVPGILRIANGPCDEVARGQASGRHSWRVDEPRIQLAKVEIDLHTEVNAG